MATIFSKIIAREIPSYTIAEDENFYAFLDISPMAKGHTLVIPKEETDYIFDLDDTTLANMTLFSKQVARAIQKAVPCRRVGVMVIGMEVAHAHIHLIPINEEADMDLSKKRLKLESSELETIAKSIREQF